VVHEKHQSRGEALDTSRQRRYGGRKVERGVTAPRGCSPTLGTVVRPSEYGR